MAEQGAMQALGVQLLDSERQPLPAGGLALARLAHISLEQLDPRLAQVRFEIAADVNNPCAVLTERLRFWPAKGASPEQVAQLDAALGHFADHCAQVLRQDVRDEPGSGAPVVWALPPRRSSVHSFVRGRGGG